MHKDVDLMRVLPSIKADVSQKEILLGHIKENIRLFDGVAFSGIKSAYEDFFNMGYDINNYTVDILISNHVKVVFTPKFHPDEGFILGGKTQNGREVSYIVDLTTSEIIKKSFSR